MNLEKFAKDYCLEIAEVTLAKNLNSEEPTVIPIREILARINCLGLGPCYATSGGVVAFTDGDKYYVSPHAAFAEKILRNNGFRPTNELYVPFSGFSMPVDENLRARWEAIKTAIPD